MNPLAAKLRRLAQAGGSLARSPVAQSVAWQGLGSVATVGAAVWVATRLGLAAQGEFGLARSWFDAAAVIAACGLPQGILHLMYRLDVPPGQLRRWMRRHLLGLLLAAALMAPLAQIVGGQTWLLVCLSLPAAVGHLLSRSVLLAVQGPRSFGFVTALPALQVFLGVLILESLGLQGGFAWVLLAAAWCSGLVSLAWVWRLPLSEQGPSAWPRSQLWASSLQSWMQAALGGALAAALLSVVAWVGRDAEETGAASLGLHAYALFAVLAGYVAPLLFDRLARQSSPTQRTGTIGQGRGGLMAAAIAPMLVLALLGGLGKLPAWFLPLGLTVPAGMVAVAARLEGTVLLARGAYTELSAQAAWRLALACTLTLLLVQRWPAAAAVGLALLVTELATWWRSAWCTARAAVPAQERGRQ